MKKLIAATLITSLLTACAGSHYRPLVDRPGAHYEQDLLECQRHAENETGAGTGAVVGALLGAALGAFVGHKTGFKGDFMRAGVVGGALGGASSGERNQTDIIKNCMNGRGYSVLR
ncbi:MAG: hypothetical protein U0989_00450 [Azonexus sp.]|nr:hypothetical protein [Azonexus sp.]